MIIWWVEELSYPFEDLRGTHAATCDPVVLVYNYTLCAGFDYEITEIWSFSLANMAD